MARFISPKKHGGAHRVLAFDGQHASSGTVATMEERKVRLLAAGAGTDCRRSAVHLQALALLFMILML
jgi:hypothetical protein